MDFYNEKIEELSNQSKSLNVGEHAKIIDTITNLEYDKENDKTIFHFKANYEHDISSHELHFAGNLTDNYSVGDKISLSFEIMPLTEEYDFVDLDYNIMFSKTGVVPEISSFISNK